MDEFSGTLAASPDETRTLYDLRTGAGWTHYDVVNGVSRILGEKKVRHWSASAQWEARGVARSKRLQAALSALYDLPASQMRRVLDNSKEQGRPEGIKRGRKKVEQKVIFPLEKQGT